MTCGDFLPIIQYTGSQNDGPQNQKWNWASFDQYIKIYFNKNTHNFEMTEPKQCLKKCIKVSNYVFTWVEVAWITIISFGKSNFILMKTKQNRQNLQVSAILVKSKKALGCLISKLCTTLLTYILIYRSKDTQIHFWFWISLRSEPI